jgi:glutathione synthase/RimK-type ligase-like ATP-grasp enzyme
VDALLWNWELESPQEALVARHVIYAAELMGLKVFPDTATCWSYDDKVSQKYQLESVGAPLVPTYVFFDKPSAMAWVEQASFPKVFKLRKGAGSKNVRLVHSVYQAKSLVKWAFGRGFKPLRFFGDALGRLATGSQQQRLVLLRKVKRFPQRLLEVYRVNKTMGRERGYAYFQDFIRDNKFDTRITVVGGRYAFGFTRNVRKGSFRASGSGSIDYDIGRINPRCVEIAFDVARKLKAQSIAFDFLTDHAGNPLITEISYAYVAEAVYNCSGYWDADMQWHEGHFWPTDLILIDLLEHLRQAKR